MALFDMFKQHNSKYKKVYVKLFKSNSYFDKEMEEVIFKYLEKNAYEKILDVENANLLIIDNVNYTYSLVNVIDFIYEDDHKVMTKETAFKEMNYHPKYIITTKLDRLVDMSIPAEKQLVLDKLENSGFTYLNRHKILYEYVRINFLRETIEFLQDSEKFDEFRYVEKYHNEFYSVLDFFRHEALHTTSVMTETVYSHLVEHHYYDQNINPEFNKHIDDAIDSLNKAYQAVGLDNANENKLFIKRPTF